MDYNGDDVQAHLRERLEGFPFYDPEHHVGVTIGDSAYIGYALTSSRQNHVSLNSHSKSICPTPLKKWTSCILMKLRRFRTVRLGFFGPPEMVKFFLKCFFKKSVVEGLPAGSQRVFIHCRSLK